MDIQSLSPLIGFAFVSSVTPGPNNLMLMASGANFGLKRTIPHMLGISMGFAFMAILVGLGLGQVFERWPLSLLILKVLSVTYLLYLAWKITRSGAPTEGDASAKPFTFLQAAAFQWVNPKAWAMAISAISLYAEPNTFTSVVVVALTFMLVNFPSVSIWTLFGVRVKHWLSTPRSLTIFNWTMAVLLVVSVLPMLVN